MQNLERLRSTTQWNCHVSDALYARNYTLCTYLLKMREYFRWEKGYALGDPLSKGDVGEWVDAREQLWQDLEQEEFACLPLGQECFLPFDNARINEVLAPEGLVYSGGYGRFGKPHFFLARLLRAERRANLTFYISATEYARDLTAPPAMLQQDQVYVRRESLQRYIWERIEEWRWRRQPGPMARALEYYGVESNLEATLERMTDAEVDAVVLHEIGEAMAGTLLGKAWEEMVNALVGSTAELIARAVRDHLADCLSTLPNLLEQEHPASIHFYFASLRGMRRELFPESVMAYQEWVNRGTLAPLQDAVQQGTARWRSLAETMLGLYRSRCDDLEKAVEGLVAVP
jgi:hypothetical protein